MMSSRDGVNCIGIVISVESIPFSGNTFRVSHRRRDMLRATLTTGAIFCLCGFVIAAPPGSPYLETGESFPTQFQQDFRNPEFDDSTMKALGPPELLKPGSDGLTVSIAVGVLEDVERIGVSYPLPLGGDADVRATVELLSFPHPDEGYGTGIILALEDGVDRGATLQFLGGDDGNRNYTAHHFVKDAEGNYDHKVESFPTEASRAVLRLRREGSTLRYLVSENDGLTFYELASIEFTDRPLKVVQLYGQRGGKPNALNARLIDFSMASPQVTLRSETVATQPETLWHWWVVTGAVAILVILAGAVLFRRRSP